MPKYPRLLAFLATSLVGIAACRAPAPPAAIDTPVLTIEHTAFVLRQPDGRVLKGTQLQGMILQLPLGSPELHTVKLASITPDPDDPDILRHEFQVQDASGQWHPACEPNVDGETWGIPIALAPGHPGRTGDIHLTCASGAVAKCIRYGYKPWAKGSKGEDLGPYHAACVHMIRADYCGDGQPHTKAGTYIRWHDDAVRWNSDPDAVQDPEYVFEAGWSPEGAVCVARTRWEELGALDAIRAACPRLAAIEPAACDEASARARGALIVNLSRLKPRLGK